MHKYKVQRLVGATWQDVGEVEVEEPLTDEPAIDILMEHANREQLVCRLLAAPGVPLTRQLKIVWGPALEAVPEGWQVRAYQNPRRPR